MKIVPSSVLFTSLFLGMILNAILWFTSTTSTTNTVREFYPSYQIFCKEAISVEKITGIAYRYKYASSGYDQKIVDPIDREIAILERAGDSLKQCVFKKEDMKKRSFAISDSLILSCRSIRESVNNRVNRRISPELFSIQYERAIATIASMQDSIVTFYENPLKSMKQAPYRSRESQLTLLQMNKNALIADLFSGRYLDR